MCPRPTAEERKNWPVFNNVITFNIYRVENRYIEDVTVQFSCLAIYINRNIVIYHSTLIVLSLPDVASQCFSSGCQSNEKAGPVCAVNCLRDRLLFRMSHI